MMNRSCLKSIALGLAGAALIATAGAQSPARTNQVNPEAVEMLRKLIEQQKAQPDRILRVPATFTNAPAPAPTAVPETKRRKKESSTSSKTNTAPAAVAKPAKEKKEAAVAKPTAAPAPATPTQAIAPAPAPVPTAEQKKLSDVEQRIDDLVRQKEARDKAVQAGGNSKTNATPAGPLTKRQKLDALLKDYIDGRVSEADYHARRAKLVAEPD